MSAKQLRVNDTRFNSQTGHIAGTKERRIPRQKSAAQREARLLQRTVVKRIKNDNPTVSELVSLVRAWDILEERIRILSGHGAPKPVDAVNGAKVDAPQRLWTYEGPDLRSV